LDGVGSLRWALQERERSLARHVMSTIIREENLPGVPHLFLIEDDDEGYGVTMRPSAVEDVDGNVLWVAEPEAEHRDPSSLYWRLNEYTGLMYESTEGDIRLPDDRYGFVLESRTKPHT
jgi:hypothetical protein